MSQPSHKGLVRAPARAPSRSKSRKQLAVTQWLHLKTRPRLLLFPAVPLPLREHVAMKPHKYVVSLVVERHHLSSVELGFLENADEKEATKQ